MPYTVNPKDFKPIRKIVQCYLEHDNKILFLFRNKSKPFGKTWDLPGGKVMRSESLSDAMIREIYEETCHRVKVADIKQFNTTYIRYFDDKVIEDLEYNLFYFPLFELLDIRVQESEHTDFKWLNPNKALTLELIPCLDHCIKCFIQYKKFISH